MWRSPGHFLLTARYLKELCRNFHIILDRGQEAIGQDLISQSGRSLIRWLGP